MPNAFTKKLMGYASLSDNDIALLETASANARALKAHHDVIREGEKPGPAFVVLEGWACRYNFLRNGSRQITAFLMPGDFADHHMSVLDEMDHTIGTLTACKVATIPRDKVDALVEATPALSLAFRRAQLVDEGVLRAWIVSLGRRDSLKRIAHLILELYMRMRNIGLTDDGSCEMPLIQTVIADALGLTPVHLNRVLRILREREVMVLGASALTILNIGELVRIAGFDDTYLHRRIKHAA